MGATSTVTFQSIDWTIIYPQPRVAAGLFLRVWVWSRKIKAWQAPFAYDHDSSFAILAHGKGEVYGGILGLGRTAKASVLLLRIRWILLAADDQPRTRIPLRCTCTAPDRFYLLVLKHGDEPGNGIYLIAEKLSSRSRLNNKLNSSMGRQRVLKCAEIQDICFLQVSILCMQLSSVRWTSPLLRCCKALLPTSEALGQWLWSDQLCDGLDVPFWRKNEDFER